MKERDSYYVGIYCRLSRDDSGGNQESMSIQNQRQLLTAYVEEKGWNLKEVYIDDGYSGTSFDRPDFARMIRDIDRGRIDCVITKDLSRLGRNYLKIGYYTEEFFPERGVRFIAINDGTDTAQQDDGFAPFRNIFNEWRTFSKDKKTQPTSGLGGAIPNQTRYIQQAGYWIFQYPAFSVSK